MSHLRIAGGIHHPSWNRLRVPDQPIEGQRETPGQGHDRNNCTLHVINGGTDGLVKLVFRRDDRLLLGVHILGDIASELIHQGQAVMHAGGAIDRFIHATFNIPTRSEAYKYAAYDGLQRLAGLPGAPSG
jgi:hypothetical protein